MKKRFLTLFFTILLAVVLAATAGAVDVNDSSVFLKQENSHTCTLTSAVMMLRRRAVLDGDANWQATTIASVKKVAWPGGLAWNFTYNGLHVTVARKSGGWAGGSLETKRQALIQLLETHPEGIVAYSPSTPHAVLLTDYDYATGIFYCSEPAPTYPAGRIPLTQSFIKGADQDAVLKKIDQLWYIDYGVSNGAGTADWAIPAAEEAVEAPQEEVQEAVPLARDAAQEVAIGETMVRLQMYALTDGQGNDVNYVKLRELAQALNGSASQFDVGYDGAVALTTHTPYLSSGDSAEAAFQGDQPYTTPAALTLVDGAATQVSAIQLTDPQGGGHIYYNLRDLGAILGYQVEWDPKAGIRIRVEDDVTADEDEIPGEVRPELEP